MRHETAVYKELGMRRDESDVDDMSEWMMDDRGITMCELWSWDGRARRMKDNTPLERSKQVHTIPFNTILSNREYSGTIAA